MYLRITLLCLFLFSPTFAATLNDNDAILADINSYRSDHGLSALKMNSYITKVATIHSQEMAANKVGFGHEGYKNRMDQLFQQFPHSNGFAENVAFTYLPSKTVTKQWLDSRGHRKNIEGNFNLTGIGIAYDKDGRVYVTQIFLRSQ